MPDIDHGPVRLADLEGRNFAFPYEVAQILRTDVRTVRRAINDGQIPATQVGATYRVPADWLREAAGSGTGITAAGSGPPHRVPAGQCTATAGRARDAASHATP